MKMRQATSQKYNTTLFYLLGKSAHVVEEAFTLTDNILLYTLLPDCATGEQRLLWVAALYHDV